MNVNEALEYAKKSIRGVASDVLATEVRRLREQREQLVGEIPFFKELSRKTLDIFDEVDLEKQEKEEEKKMTVDVAISNVEDFIGATPQEKVLAAEVKSLRRVHIELNEEIDRLRGVIRDWQENRKELGGMVRKVLGNFGV